MQLLEDWCNGSKIVEYPRHTQLSRRSKCNTPLLKRISVGKGGKLVPRKTFVYNSIISALAAMVSRKGFIQKCEHWRDRTNLLPTNTLADIYEGCVWKESRTSLSFPTK